MKNCFFGKKDSEKWLVLLLHALIGAQFFILGQCFMFFMFFVKCGEVIFVQVHDEQCNCRILVNKA